MKVPTYQTNHPATRPLTPQDVMASPDASGGVAVGRALQNVGGTMERLASSLDKISETADDVASSDAATYYHRKAGESVVKFRGLVGNNAIEVSGRVLKELDQEREALAKSLKNERQRANFYRKSDSTYISATESVEMHVGQEANRAEKASIDAEIEQGISNAETFLYDPTYSTTMLERIQDRLYRFYGTEEASAKLKQYASEMDSRQILAFLDKDDARHTSAALEVWMARKSSMTTRDRDEVGKRIEEKLKQYAGNKIANEIVAKHRFDGSDLIDSIAAKEELDEMDEGPTKRAAEIALRDILALNEAKREKRVEDAYNEGLVEVNHGRPVPERVWRVLESKYNSGAEKAYQLKERQRQRAAHFRGEPPSQEELESAATLLAAIKTNPIKFGSMTGDEADYVWKIIAKTPKPYKDNLENAMADALVKARSAVDLKGEDYSFIKRMALEFGAKASREEDWADKKNQSILAAVERSYKERKAADEAKFDPLQWADDERVKNRTSYKLLEKGKDKATSISDVTEPEARAIRQALIRKGFDRPSEDDIVSAYNAWSRPPRGKKEDNDKFVQKVKERERISTAKKPGAPGVLEQLTPSPTASLP